MPQKALYLPDISGTPLNQPGKVHTTDLCLGKVSVISILSSKISEVLLLSKALFCALMLAPDTKHNVCRTNVE